LENDTAAHTRGCIQARKYTTIAPRALFDNCPESVTMSGLKI
jgi:hypothetical protein